MHQRRLVVQVALLCIANTAFKVRVVTRYADLQYPALHPDKQGMPMALDEGVLQIDPLAMHAAAFLRLHSPIFTRANVARSQLIPLCSALTGLL